MNPESPAVQATPRFLAPGRFLLEESALLSFKSHAVANPGVTARGFDAGKPMTRLLHVDRPDHVWVNRAVVLK